MTGVPKAEITTGQTQRLERIGQVPILLSSPRQHRCLALATRIGAEPLTRHDPQRRHLIAVNFPNGTPQE